MPWMDRNGEATNCGLLHDGFGEEWLKVEWMWPLTSRTLKPTLDQSIVPTGGGGKAAMLNCKDLPEGRLSLKKCGTKKCATMIRLQGVPPE